MEHPIYWLDKGIVVYLDKMFGERLKEPFTSWKKQNMRRRAGVVAPHITPT